MATTIENERHYRITKTQAKKFENTIEEMMMAPEYEVHSVVRQAQCAW